MAAAVVWVVPPVHGPAAVASSAMAVGPDLAVPLLTVEMASEEAAAAAADRYSDVIVTCHGRFHDRPALTVGWAAIAPRDPCPADSGEVVLASVECAEEEPTAVGSLAGMEIMEEDRDEPCREEEEVPAEEQEQEQPTEEESVAVGPGRVVGHRPRRGAEARNVDVMHPEDASRRHRRRARSSWTRNWTRTWQTPSPRWTRKWTST